MRRYLSHLCPKPFAQMHREWNKLVVDNQFNNFQAHRESAKSTILAVGYPLWRICCWLYIRQKLGQPAQDEHGAILGPNDDDAKDRLRQVRYELEHNQKLREDFKPQKGSLWTDDRFNLAGVLDVKNPTLQASGLISFNPGCRLTFGILDDTTSPLHVLAHAQRNKQHNALLHIVEPAMLDEGVIICIHTTYHSDDLPARLAKDDRYHSQKWPLVLDEERKVVQWPEAWPWDRVKIVMKKPLVFARQYQLKEVADKDRLIPMPEFYQARSLEWRNGEFRMLGKPVRIATGVDPAISERDLNRGSWTAIVTAAVFPNMDAWPIHAIGGRWPVERIFQEIKGVHGQWRPLSIWIESVAFSAVFARMIARTSGIPARESKVAGLGDKIQRITGTLNPPMSNHKVRFPDDVEHDTRKDNMGEMVQDVTEFPGDRLDFLDAFEHLYRNVNTSPVYARAAGDVISRTRRAVGGGSSWIHTGRDWD